MGAYSRWTLIRGWALIRINTVVGSAELSKCEHENKTRGNWGSIHSFFLFPAQPTFRVPFTFTFASSALPESLQQATLPPEKPLDIVFFSSEALSACKNGGYIEQGLFAVNW